MNQSLKLTPTANQANRLNVTESNSADCAPNTQSDPYSETYFDALYHDNSDPWHYQTRWYEKRKRDMCLAVLPKSQYTDAIELGCGNGVFSELLASRCQALVSIDGHHQAVQLAKQRLAKSAHVRVIQGVIPSVLPNNDSGFDLIVISEILYYLSSNDIDTVIAWIQQNLAVGGSLLCCHWRYTIDDFAMTGDTVHQRLNQAFDGVNNENCDKRPPITSKSFAVPRPTFTHQSQIIDSDFLLDVWQHTHKTVAMQENLV